MTGIAKRHQITFLVAAALCQWFLVMNQVGGGVSVLCQTPFAQRVSSDISVADFSPRASVPFVAVVAAREVIVVRVHQPLMFFTIHTVCQLGTSRVTTRALRSSWHRVISFLFLLIISYHKGATVK